MYDDYINLKKDIDSDKIKINDDIIPTYLKTFYNTVSTIVNYYRDPSKNKLFFDLKKDSSILLKLYEKINLEREKIRKRRVEESTESEQEIKRRKISTLIDTVLAEELIKGPLNIPPEERKDGSKSKKKSRRKSKKKSRRKSKKKSRRKY